MLQNILANETFSLSVLPSTTRSQHNGQVIQSEVLSVQAPNLTVNVLRKIFAEIPTNGLGGSCTILPYDFNRDVNGDKYCDMLVWNNNFHNNTCAIALHNLQKDIFSKDFKYPINNDFNGNFIQFLYSVGVQLVEPTNCTAKTGTFIYVVHNHKKEHI